MITTETLARVMAVRHGGVVAVDAEAAGPVVAAAAEAAAENRIMLVRNQIISVVGALLVGCGPQPRTTGTPAERSARPREYVTTIKSPDGAELAVINCRYLGKKPEEPIEKEITRDWKTQDTDFYHYAITNISEHPIELNKVEYRLAEVRGGQVNKTAAKADIEEEFGAAVIEPGQAVTRRNSWVWGLNEQTRTMHKTYFGRSNKQDVKLNVVLVYRKEE